MLRHSLFSVSSSIAVTAYKSLLDPLDAREHQELEPCWSPALPAYQGAEGKDEEPGWGLSQNGILPLLIFSQLLQQGDNPHHCKPLPFARHTWTSLVAQGS